MRSVARYPRGGCHVELLTVSKETKIQAPLRNLWFGEGQRIFMTLTVNLIGVDELETGCRRPLRRCSSSGTSKGTFGLASSFVLRD